MTNAEFIRAKLPDFLISDSTIAANLQLHDLDPYSLIDSESDRDLDLAYVDCLQYILRLPSSISQGGFSLSAIDKDFYKAEISRVLSKHGLEPAEASLKPDITKAGSWK